MLILNVHYLQQLLSIYIKAINYTWNTLLGHFVKYQISLTESWIYSESLLQAPSQVLSLDLIQLSF